MKTQYMLDVVEECESHLKNSIDNSLSISSNSNYNQVS